jgi:hypothetical protein
MAKIASQKSRASKRRRIMRKPAITSPTVVKAAPRNREISSR